MPNNKSLDVILEFEPDVDFEQEFSDFIEEVLSWNNPDKENNKQNDIPKTND